MRYLIVGNSAAGISAARGIRTRDPEGKILLFSDEPHPYYSRMVLTYFLAGAVGKETLFAQARDIYARLGVEAHLGERIVEVSPARGDVAAASGRRFSFDWLLLATGAAPVIPQIPGSALPGVLPVRTLEHAEEICRRAAPGGDAVVLGGGLVGMQAAQALRRRGLAVTLLVSSTRLLSRNLDEEAAGIVLDAALHWGVRVLFRQDAREIATASDSSLTVILAGGERLKADLIILAKGVEPSTGLMRGAGMSVNEGVLVDPWLRTSCSRVFAAGDVAEVADGREARVNPIWPNAVEQGYVAGLNMAGAETRCPSGTAMNITQLFGVKIASIGRVKGGPGVRETVYSNPPAGVYRKFFGRDGTLEGALLVGDVADAGIFQRLVRSGGTGGRHIAALMNHSAGLANFLCGPLRARPRRRD